MFESEEFDIFNNLPATFGDGSLKKEHKMFKWWGSKLLISHWIILFFTPSGLRLKSKVLEEKQCGSCFSKKRLKQVVLNRAFICIYFSPRIRLYIRSISCGTNNTAGIV